MILPALVSYEQIPSLIHFFYTGDYSVSANDLSLYPVPPSPDDCVTCPQICQLLRVHLAMFQTALLLRITDLQALAFRRFRELMDTATAFALKSAVRAVYTRRPVPDGTNSFQITGLKEVTDYRPELVLPAILRYCGYRRLNPVRSARGRRRTKFGEAEFAELRQLSADFNRHMTRGLWLDTLDIVVPTIQFPGDSAAIRSIHPYMDSHPPPRENPRRSNYQYVTYLQPHPFESFDSQRHYLPATPGDSPISSPTTQSSNQSMLSVGRSHQDFQAMLPQALEEPHFSLGESLQFSAEEQAVFDHLGRGPTPGAIPDAAAVAPVNTTEGDWTQIVNWSGGDLQDIDFDSFTNDHPLPQREANISDLTQGTNWAETDLNNVDFGQLLNDNATEGLFLDPSGLGLSWDMDIDPHGQTSLDLSGLPSMDSGERDDNDSLFMLQPESMDLGYSAAMQSSVSATQEEDGASPRYNLRTRSSKASYVDMTEEDQL